MIVINKEIGEVRRYGPRGIVVHGAEPAGWLELHYWTIRHWIVGAVRQLLAMLRG